MIFRIILLYSSLAVGFLIGVLQDCNKQHAKQHSKHKPARLWLRCAVCGCYQHSTSDYCLNHSLPVYMLFVSEKQHRRIDHHSSYLWTHPLIKRHQDRFIAFVMRLEDLTNDEWTTEAAITIFEKIGPASVSKFAEFLLALEDAACARLDVDDVVKQFLVSKEMERDQAKVTQN